jgi:hypothetical protein
VLRKTLGPKMDEVTGDWGKMHNAKLRYLHSSLNIEPGDQIKKNEIVEACDKFGERRSVYRFWWGNLS